MGSHRSEPIGHAMPSQHHFRRVHVATPPFALKACLPKQPTVTTQRNMMAANIHPPRGLPGTLRPHSWELKWNIPCPQYIGAGNVAKAILTASTENGTAYTEHR